MSYMKIMYMDLLHHIIQIMWYFLLSKPQAQAVPSFGGAQCQWS